jgi:hypothetical protein
MALLLHYLVAKLFRWWLDTWVDYLSKLTFSMTSGHSVLSDEHSAVPGFGVWCLCFGSVQVGEYSVGGQGDSGRFRT